MKLKASSRLTLFNYLGDFRGSEGDGTFLNATEEKPASLFPLFCYLPPSAEFWTKRVVVSTGADAFIWNL